MEAEAARGSLGAPVGELGRGDPANYDIVCPTNWMAARLKGLGWLDPLPIELIPNFQNLDPQYLTLNWDKGAHYFMPWQAGYTGIAVNESVTGRPLTKAANANELVGPGQVVATGGGPPSPGRAA